MPIVLKSNVPDSGGPSSSWSTMPVAEPKLRAGMLLRPRRPSRATIVYVLFLLGLGVPGGYVLFLAKRSFDVYRHFKYDHRGFRGRVHRADAELGYGAVPASRGAHVWPVGPPVPMRYDAEGLRIPADAPAVAMPHRPLVLALGCSYTYGDACLAEETYPWLVARRLGGTSLNAGKCGYGLAQMLILARRLIPRYEPEYVLVQFSHWLAGRGTSGFARSTFGKIPVPFLTLSQDGQVGVEPPAFRTRVFDSGFDRFDDQKRGVGEFFRLFWQSGAPLFVHDDVQMAAHGLKRLIGTVPPAAKNREALNRAVYREIGRAAQAHGSTMVIVRVSHPLEKHWQKLTELWPSAVVADAQSALDARVPEQTRDAYDRRFGHWRGTPPRLVDTHPNPDAHHLIAEAIMASLRLHWSREPGPEAARITAPADPP
jgi:hypothetical protein